MKVRELFAMSANDGYNEVDFYDEEHQIDETVTEDKLYSDICQYAWNDAEVVYWYANFEAGVIQISAVLPDSSIKSSRNLRSKKSIKASTDSLYNRLLSVVDNPDDDIETHESDIYVLKTPKTTKIIKDYYNAQGLKSQATTFIDNITHRPFYEIPFGYMDEFIDKRRKGLD